MTALNGCRPDNPEGLRDYEYVLVPHEKCPHPDHRGARVAGIDRLPDHYLRHFGVVS